jgi:hypothetical protein
VNPKIESIMKDFEHAIKTTSRRRYVLLGNDFVMFADNINKHSVAFMHEANIVIDLVDKKVIKNRYF